jgi:hypothetical protein
MANVVVNGMTLRIEGADVSGERVGQQMQQLRDTLALIPPAHLVRLPTITVGHRPSRGGGGAANSIMPGGPFIRLNVKCFDPRTSPWNRLYNYTLLHEAGHIIDWSYNAMTLLRTANPEGFRALMGHPHRGATQGPSEHYADGYADYLLPTGRISGLRYDAIVTSAPFTNVISVCAPRLGGIDGSYCVWEDCES